MKKISSAIVACSLSMGIASNAHAFKLINAQDNQTYYLEASAHDINRITLENGRLRKVMGKSSDFFVEKDDRTGQFLIRFRDDKKTSSLVIITEDGKTYTLVLKPIDIPAESFVIREEHSNNRPQVANEKKEPLEQNIRDLILAMAGKRLPLSKVYFDENQNSVELTLWKGTRFFHVASYESGSLKGEKYRLFNVSDKSIKVAEQEFFKDGVVAVSIQTHELDIGRDTYVYIVNLVKAD